MSLKGPFNKSDIQEFKKRAEQLKKVSQNIYSNAVSNNQNQNGSPMVPISYQKTERSSFGKSSKNISFLKHGSSNSFHPMTYSTPLKVSNSVANLRSVSTESTQQYLNSLKQFISQYSGGQREEEVRLRSQQQSLMEQPLYLYCSAELGNKDLQFVDEKTLQIKEFNAVNKLRLIRFFHLQRPILTSWPELKGIADNLSNRLLVIAGSRECGKMELLKRCFQLVMHRLASSSSHSRVSIRFLQRIAIERVESFSFRGPRGPRREAGEQVTEVRVIDIRYSVDDIWDKIIGQIAANGEKLRFVHKDLELVKSHSFDHKLVVLEIDQEYEFKILITNDLVTEQDLENSSDFYATLRSIVKSKVPHFTYFDFPASASQQLENLEITGESTQILYAINGGEIKSMVRTLESYEAVEQFLYK